VIAELNFVLAAVTCVLAAYIGWSHYRERGLRHAFSLVGLTLLVLTVVTLITAAPNAFGVPLDEREPWRFAAAVFRGIAFVLLASYALFRWEIKR